MLFLGNFCEMQLLTSRGKKTAKTVFPKISSLKLFHEIEGKKCQNKLNEILYIILHLYSYVLIFCLVSYMNRFGGDMTEPHHKNLHQTHIFDNIILYGFQCTMEIKKSNMA